MKKPLPTVIGIALAALLCVVFPPFHIHSLKAVRESQEDRQFNAAEFADRFWTEELLPATEKAGNAEAVLEAIATEPKTVRGKFGRTVGVGSSYYLFVRGSGRVVGADDNSIGLSLKPEGDAAQIIIELGFVFGNAVREATGLISASSYPNAQEFNDISAALNSLVETNVLPQLQRIAKVGSRIQFVGCVEVGDEDQDLKPLKLVPVVVKAN